MDNSDNLLDNDSDKARLFNNYFASVFIKDNGLMSEFLNGRTTIPQIR